jgi:Protein of unknown function (DUF2934)
VKFPKQLCARGKNIKKVVEKFAPMPNDKKQSLNAATAVEMESSNLPDQKTVDLEEVRNLAYRFWQKRGCPTGSSEEDWFRAERELASAAENRE